MPDEPPPVDRDPFQEPDWPPASDDEPAPQLSVTDLLAARLGKHYQPKE